MDTPINSCACKDFQVNGLGTCKHIEAVLLNLNKRRYRQGQLANTKVEIYRDGRNGRIKVRYPATLRKNTRIRQLLCAYFDEEDSLYGDPLQSMAAVCDRLNNETKRVRQQLHISAHLQEWLKQLQRAADQRATQRRFRQDLHSGRTSLDVVKLPLYPYQQEGMMHLAFTGRALLADEMGLGKTVQAIAGAELLNRLDPLQKVLVISPASLKSEWLEQIDKFSDRSAQIIQGARKNRYALYRQPAFFYLANYEQMLYDGDFINKVLKPDLIILDEAQRIKNWQTKTAAAIKALHSPYAFVLTGTPLENRIDEIYSIVQFLDPGLFGPLFRFNRDFHQLDDKGQAIGYKNLDRMHERLQPIMLRRRKEEVEGELPPRSIHHYYVPMSREQSDLYEEHYRTVAQLSATAKKRPLTKKERDLLMLSLSCMRMTCDSAYILDQTTQASPKLDELERILAELPGDSTHKIIVFSEWERMLNLLAHRLAKAGIDYAWHTGSLTPKKRRQQINRFKHDPQCRLFLATDSAATGLNLQIARVVVNLDLPWNPAKLEQRIARAWRKHQKHPVSVINLVSEHTIEHRMLDVLRHKTSLADAVVDGAPDGIEMDISVGRGAFMERLNGLLSTPAPKRTAFERLTEIVFADLGDKLQHLEQRGNTLLAVTEDTDPEFTRQLQQHIGEHYQDSSPQLETLNRKTYETLQRLAEAGVIQFTQAAQNGVNTGNRDQQKALREQQRREGQIRKYLELAAEKKRMAQLLAEGRFIREALAPINDALDAALSAAFLKTGDNTDAPVNMSQVNQLQTAFQLPGQTTSLVATLRHERDSLSEAAAKESLASASKVLDAIQAAMQPSA
ncbi:MAG: DEAD/DEAH box helicase [Gammaproteobacteria bacterium]|nr:DEAD/DEAH box helicase [Gammaproteobacteria bacterium]